MFRSTYVFHLSLLLEVERGTEKKGASKEKREIYIGCVTCVRNVTLVSTKMKENVRGSNRKWSDVEVIPDLKSQFKCGMGLIYMPSPYPRPLLRSC
jgi:hypothetical protein